jgi:hypothetical protein
MGEICEHGDELSGSMKAADFLICWVTTHFEKKILHHWVCHLDVMFKERSGLHPQSYWNVLCSLWYDYSVLFSKKSSRVQCPTFPRLSLRPSSRVAVYVRNSGRSLIPPTVSPRGPRWGSRQLTLWINTYVVKPFLRASYLFFFWSNALSQTYLYQKDERALPGNLQNRRLKKCFLSPLNVVSLTASPTISFLCLSLQSSNTACEYNTHHINPDDGDRY